MDAPQARHRVTDRRGARDAALSPPAAPRASAAAGAMRCKPSSRYVRTSSAGTESIRRAHSRSTSNVASSAQCRSSTTTTEDDRPASSSISARGTSCGWPPASTCVAQLAFDHPSDVKQRPQRPRREQRIARRPQHPHRPASLPTEPAHQRCLADARLAMHQHHQPDPTLRNLASAAPNAPSCSSRSSSSGASTSAQPPVRAHHIILTVLHERNRRPEPINRP